MLTKEKIIDEIKRYVAQYEKKSALTRIWRTPVVGFADACHPGFHRLKEIVGPDHGIPQDVLPDGTIVLTYFVPFAGHIVDSNGCKGVASPEWAEAYEDTNAMFIDLNEQIMSFLRSEGYRAAVSKEASVFDRDKILSRWSQRHIAVIAGLGTFGLNNMLITEAGCCGRIGTIVTNLDVMPDSPIPTENCLFKRNGTCGACVRRCPAGALTAGGFNRVKCYENCLQNAKLYTQFGNSYASAVGEETADSGSEVCGKCLVNLPCSVKKP
jgi:epoxyqueuosine reductase QueG